MNAATVHRGPDGSATYENTGVTLGHNRLAIIDLSPEAGQPMTDASGRFIMVFNGEIYNFKELREQLTSYAFKTQGDSEVILAAYQTWGAEAFGKLNGIFALAIWDTEEQSLLLARDSVGVKPLYYHVDGSRLVFSSEIKAILETGVERVLDQTSLEHYLRLMYVPEPNTMFKNIKKLPKGNMLVYKGGVASISPFVSGVEPVDRPASYKEAVQTVRTKVEAAVTRQLVSDRPVGIYLSGGIDSSVVLASAAQTHPHIDTYSVGFSLDSAEEQEKFNIDSRVAQNTATFFGSTHHEFSISAEDAINLLPETIRRLDEPIGNATALAQLFLARKVKQTATVVLSGEGGDELFGGYERYRLAFVASMLSPWIPRTLASKVPKLHSLHVSGEDRFAQLMFQKESAIRRIFPGVGSMVNTRALFSSEFSNSLDIATNLMRADENHWLVDEALMRADKTSMASGVELRVPLLDLDLISYAHVLPRQYKVTPFKTKRVLKDAFRDVLPKEVLSQPKRGWFSPGAKWLRHPAFVRLADEVFSQTYAPKITALFNLPEIHSMLEDHRDKRAYNYTLLWALLVFFMWAREYDVSV